MQQQRQGEPTGATKQPNQTLAHRRANRTACSAEGWIRQKRGNSTTARLSAGTAASLDGGTATAVRRPRRRLPVECWAAPRRRSWARTLGPAAARGRRGGAAAAAYKEAPAAKEAEGEESGRAAEQQAEGREEKMTAGRLGRSRGRNYCWPNRKARSQKRRQKWIRTEAKPRSSKVRGENS